MGNTLEEEEKKSSEFKSVHNSIKKVKPKTTLYFRRGKHFYIHLQDCEQRVLDIQLRSAASQVEELIQEVNLELEKLGCKTRVIGLRSVEENELVDYYLTLKKRSMSIFQNYQSFLALSTPISAPTPPVKINFFDKISKIGSGGFSKVYKVRRKDTGDLFALKVIKKEQDEAKTEISILHKVSGHLFFPVLHHFFETEKKWYIVMELVPGGEMYELLNKCQKMTEEQAKFYFAEIVLAIEFLHSKKILYRDLKPENIMIDIDGHIKLIDFGLSKENISLHIVTSSFCGSPEYMSPEMLIQSGHSLNVDIYSLGVVLYEFLTGLPPHYSSNQQEMVNSILNKTEKVSFPKNISVQAIRLIKSLLLYTLESYP